jgi:hypothetical protein
MGPKRQPKAALEIAIEKFLAPELRQRRADLVLGPVERRLYKRAFADFEAYARERGWPIGPHALAAYLIETDMGHGARSIVVASYFYQNTLALEPIFAALRHCTLKKSNSARSRAA